MTKKTRKISRNVLSLVSKLTSDIEVVEKSFDELVVHLKDKKIRAFSCAAITLDGEAMYNYVFDTDHSFFSLIGVTDIMKENLIKDHVDNDD